MATTNSVKFLCNISKYILSSLKWRRKKARDKTDQEQESPKTDWLMK